MSRAVMSPIRILLADDQAIFRLSLHAYLDLQSGYKVVGEAANGEEAVRMAKLLRPDVVLMDVRMPVMDGVEAAAMLCAGLPGCRVIMLTTFDDDQYVFEALRNGAAGYLLKDAPAEKLFEAVNAAARGESYLPTTITARVLAEFSRLARRVPADNQALPDPLSERERNILRMVANGSTNRQIADSLSIAEGTVKNYITRIFDKLGVDDRTQAAIKARDLGIF